MPERCNHNKLLQGTMGCFDRQGCLQLSPILNFPPIEQLQWSSPGLPFSPILYSVFLNLPSTIFFCPTRQQSHSPVSLHVCSQHFNDVPFNFLNFYVAVVSYSVSCRADVFISMSSCDMLSIISLLTVKNCLQSDKEILLL